MQGVLGKNSGGQFFQGQDVAQFRSETIRPIDEDLKLSARKLAELKLRRRTVEPSSGLPSIHAQQRLQVQTTLATPNATFDMPYNFSSTARNLPLSVFFKREQQLDQAKL